MLTQRLQQQQQQQQQQHRDATKSNTDSTPMPSTAVQSLSSRKRPAVDLPLDNGYSDESARLRELQMLESRLVGDADSVAAAANRLVDDDDFDTQFADGDVKIFDACSDASADDNSAIMEEDSTAPERRHQQIVQLHVDLHKDMMDTMKTQHAELVNLFKQFLAKS